MCTLEKLEMGKEGRIKEINCNGSIKRRMMDLGIIKGTIIKPILKSPAGNPRAYEVRNCIIAIRSEDAKSIKLI